MWAPEIEKSGKLGSKNREIWEIRKTGQVGGALLCQIWHNRPQSGALSGIDYPRAGQDRPGPADGPQDPKKSRPRLPWGGVYIRIGGCFGPAIYGETYRKCP